MMLSSEDLADVAPTKLKSSLAAFSIKTRKGPCYCLIKADKLALVGVSPLMDSVTWICADRGQALLRHTILVIKSITINRRLSFPKSIDLKKRVFL